MVKIVSSLPLIGSSSPHASRRIFGHSQRIPILMMHPFSDKKKQLPRNKMNVGAEVLKLLKKISNNEKQRIEKLQCMQSAYIKITEYLQEGLLLDSGFLADMVCLHPLNGKDAHCC